MSYTEDIFGGGSAFKVVVRWNQLIIHAFDKVNTKSFKELHSIIVGKELACYFLRVNDNEDKLVCPLPNHNLFLELHLEWQDKTFDYKVKVKTNKKSRLTHNAIIPVGDNYVIHEKCILDFIDITESRFPTQELVELHDRVNKLEVLPRTRIENHLELWDKWIEAQELIIERNAAPFKVRKPYELVEIKNEDGNLVRLKFFVNIIVPEHNEYREIEDELLKELEIHEQFDKEGNIQLKLDDIFRGLDAALRKNFKDKIEREPAIVSILKLKPLPIEERISRFFMEAGYQISCKEEAYEKNQKTYSNIVVTSLNTPKHQIISYMESQGFELYRIRANYEILNHGSDITKNKAINKKYKLKFANSDKDTGYGHILPVPENNVITIEDKDEVRLAMSRVVLKRIYGDKNVRFSQYLVFSRSRYQAGQSLHRSNFTDEFWKDVKRDLYALDFEVELNETTETLSFEFETKEECIGKFDKLCLINKFDFFITPDHPDFKFKVKTNLLGFKTEKQIQQERIANLRGVEFRIRISSSYDGEPLKRPKYLTCGKLNVYESTPLSLTFNVPYRTKEEKKDATALIEYLASKPSIDQLEPNLIGDLAKIKWLRTAMAKVASPSDKPNGKAVNGKLAEFIFDSSKAQEVFKDIREDSEEWVRVKNNQLLQLNVSQLKAVLTALHATDLALIQGPPGTGKTTVIAEMIWQMISEDQSQKILLTSETNLAVDNALEKLINNENTLVKPLRFGRDTKFEEEGKKYSINRIMKWIDEKYVGTEYDDDTLEEGEEDEELDSDNLYNNTVQLWMNRIAAKSQQSKNPKYEKALRNWAIELSQPTKEIKRKFKEKYFKHANVIGSTCISSGSPSFIKTFQVIYNQGKKFFEEPKPWNYIPVAFDTVIMDEASKATPPELLLPLCFGKKSIVIGDHKQLPPMLNDKEFKEALLELETEKAKQLSEEIDKEFLSTSQFERLIMHPKVNPSIIGRLNIQYRMHPHINDVIGQFYEGETDEGLFPADELKKHADDRNLNNPFSRYHGLLYNGLLKPDIHTIWVNVSGPEEQSGTSRINLQEVDAVKSILNCIREAEGFDEYFGHWNSIKDQSQQQQQQEIGIISFYGQQVKKLQDVRRYAQQHLNIPIRLKTVDKFQGMERNIVIVSTVRSDKLLKNGQVIKNTDIGFAKAPERLNVALSRARRLLIVVGNLQFFESYKNKNGDAIYRKAIDSIRKNGLIIEYYKALNNCNA